MTDTGERPSPTGDRALAGQYEQKSSHPYWRRLRRVLAVFLFVALLPLAFYGGFEFAANRITTEYNLPRTSRNSIKHALTAASIYSTLRTLSIDRDDAENIVLALGFINEKLETYVKIGRLDSLAEQCKDLHNNWTGIVAAEWRLTHAEGKSLASIMAGLAQTGTLILQSGGTPEPPSANARTWFDEHRPLISQKAITALNATLLP